MFFQTQAVRTQVVFGVVALSTIATRVASISQGSKEGLFRTVLKLAWTSPLWRLGARLLGGSLNSWLSVGSEVSICQYFIHMYLIIRLWSECSDPSERMLKIHQATLKLESLNETITKQPSACVLVKGWTWRNGTTQIRRQSYGAKDWPWYQHFRFNICILY